MAAILGLRLSNFIMNELTLKIKRRVFWSDSKDVLFWIRSDARKFQQFVALRIGEILEGSHANEWNWVPTVENVADEATKWKGAPNFNKDARWFCGPGFLYKDENFWPKSEFTSYADTAEFVCHMKQRTFRPSFWQIVPDFLRFSKWERLRGCQRFVLKFCKLITKLNPKLNNTIRTYILRNDIQVAEYFLFMACQEESFGEEMETIRNKGHVKSSSCLYKLSPFLDEFGVLRIRGRIDLADVMEDTRRPIILRKGHIITNLIIDFYHRKYHHHHNEIIVNELRQRFWISGMRAAVRAVNKSCQVCKNRRAVPACPEMGSLPVERLSPYTRPFTFVGVDYFGPLQIIVGRRTEKRWGTLFTCMTTRAVDIEIASSLSTDSFLLIFKQFISHRGIPPRVLSDNGTNFRGASRILLMETEKVSSSALEQKYPNIEWIFIPPASPHMGGCWERMIRSM